MYVYIYIYIHMYMYIYIYIYILFVYLHKAPRGVPKESLIGSIEGAPEDPGARLRKTCGEAWILLPAESETRA